MEDFAQTNAGHDIFPYMQRAALDMILETAMGVSMGIQVKRQSDYADCIERMIHIIFKRSTLPWFMSDWTFSLFPAAKETYDKDLKTLHDFTQSVIKDRKEGLTQSMKTSVSEESEPRKKVLHVHRIFLS